ncbi:hypothetical protein TNCV_2147371 [Trichonephila clavipes]|uniref:Uncharacterized protein n=1 Tax=Trichonephila clavipes TaxID=2585209 RepID=A0A8X6VNC3_TRICX|nr:hypothetical protein TNCV_2147371 [Trichonephila clavipes]
MLRVSQNISSLRKLDKLLTNSLRSTSSIGGDSINNPRLRRQQNKHYASSVTGLLAVSDMGKNRKQKTPGRFYIIELTYGVLLEESVAVDDDNVGTDPILAYRDILEFVQSSKNIIDADSENENEMNNAAPLFPCYPK